MTMTFRQGFGDYQRQLWNVDAAGLPLEAALEQIDLLGADVVPVLRREMAAGRPSDVADAPTHERLVLAKYGGEPARQPVPSPNRGNNLTDSSPYQDGANQAATSEPASA